MPRRYQQDSEGNMRRVWNGKLPEDFTPADTLLFMAETAQKLKEKEDILRAIKEGANTPTAKSRPRQGRPIRSALDNETSV